MSTEAKIRGYTDPRTGEYVWATEANKEQVQEGIGFLIAWSYYWDGPAGLDQKRVFTREDWLTSASRQAWLDDLADEQRTMLEDSFPPEEVPVLEAPE